MTSDTTSLALRDATRDDAPRIAALHAASWRTAYRGILTDLYLDGPVEEDRRALWAERMAASAAGRFVVLAEPILGLPEPTLGSGEPGPELAGFVCGFADHDPRFGSLVDNLHAAPAGRGRGVGRALLREAGRRFADLAPCRPVHLTCLDRNAPAMGFYARLGGTAAERQTKREPDGSLCAVTLFAWASPAALIAACA